MDTAEIQERQIETQSIGEEDQSNDGSPPSSQERSGPNRLMYQIRSMPLVSLLLGRNVPARNVIHDANSFFLMKCIMGFHLVILVTLVILSTFAIYHYNVRFYKNQTRPSETLIVCWLLRGIWRTLNSSWSLRYYCVGVETTPNLKLSQTFYNIVSILWIGLAVIFLGVSPKEDLKTTSSKICYFLLWATIASYVVPMLAYTLMCFLLYLTLFIVIYFRHGTIPLSSGAMPLSMLRKLKVQRYREVLKAINTSENINKLASEEGIGNTKPTDLGLTTPITIDDPLSDCVNNAEMLAERICSICILKINDDDKVFLLPCDMRHLFHRDCLRKWFKRSSECPICRSNISEILAERDKPVNKGIFEQSQPMGYSDQYPHQDPIPELGQYPVHESDCSRSDEAEQDHQEQIEEQRQQYDERDNEVVREDGQDANYGDGNIISMSNGKTNENNKQSVNSSNGDFIVVVDSVVVAPADHVDSVDVVKEVHSEHILSEEAVVDEITSETICEESHEPSNEPLNESLIESPNESSEPLNETMEKTEQPPNQLSKEDIILQESISEPDEKLQNTHKQVETEHGEKSEEREPLEVVIVEEKKEKVAAVEERVQNDPIL
ncbi:hypothetical protein MACJ_001122 [Theileria orientalis]|uniref:RING-type domain-containing protein n=1 Tax=Theileria orientalis TaxID=68886 RepID=A0A976M7W5_THEOR|nr:hypothetical protein MACJ_001122 [Theileria orientalis]